MILSVVLSTSAFAQKSAGDGPITVKPYWTKGDGRTLAFTGEVIYSIKDSITSTLKAKWEGGVEVFDADGRTMTVGISEQIVENKITFNDLMADVEFGQQATEVVVRMDKAGKITAVENFEDIRKEFVEGKEKDHKSEVKKLSKEDKTAYTDSLNNALLKDDMFKQMLIAYSQNYLSLFGKTVPAAGDTVKADATIETKRFFAEATKDVTAKSTCYINDVKGTKFTYNEVYNYTYKAMEDFLVGFKDRVTDGETTVKDHIATTFDTKVGWQQKITEELTISNGKYKVVYKWSVKFNKDK